MVGTSSAQADPLIGSTLGTYTVLERIGMGGMAHVYLVEHQTLKKQFAVKVLSKEHASSEEARARFTQEAHAASQLDHENIVTISDFGFTPDGRPYYVMELLRGQTLADRLDAGRMTLEEVVAVSIPVARALSHAHAEGVIHRDVKPENIFLVQRSQGRWSVKVLDFGIARLPVNDRMTKTGQALGSPMYMAPEMCRGEEVDQRADIYSFGIVLYLMLAGRVPFQDDNLLKVLQMQVSSPLPLPTSFNPDIPPDLEMVILRALMKEPSDRFETMEELQFALEATLPQGSDVLLLQAQFGTSTTPFPGTLDRVREARLSKPPFAAVTGQHNLTPSITGQHDLTPSASVVQQRAVSMPPAPKRKRGGAVFATLLLLGAGGGAGYYAWMQSQDPQQPSAELQLPAPPAKPPAPAPAPTAVAPPAEPAQPSEPAPAVAPAPEPAPEPPPPPPEPAPRPAVTKAPKTAPARPAQRIATGTKSPAKKTPAPPPEPPPPANLGSGSAVPVETPAPPPPAPPVVVAPVTPPPAPPPVVPAKPAPPVVVETGSMDATPVIANLDVNGPLPSSVVRRSVERVLPALRACYHSAASAQRKTPAVSVTLAFEIDENSSATNVSASGGNFGSLSSCASGAVGRIQTQQAPDVGTAQVSLTIKFTPN